MARRHLVTLPYEVRDKIFKEYFRVEGGYVFNRESEKLTTADGQPIDFSLMYTCHSIANNTQHLPFAFNNISFSTFFSPEWMAWAGRHQFLSQFICLLRADLIYHLQGAEMSPELESALQDKFPHLMPDFKRRMESIYSSRRFFWKSSGGLKGYAFQYKDKHRYVLDIIGDKGDELVRLWGINAFMAREAITFSLRFLGERQYFELSGLLNRAFHGCKGTYDPQDLLDLNLDPFFRQLSVDQSRRLRSVTIIEDAYAVCSPSTHAMGLIEFRKENPRLRIKRHLKLSRRIPAAFHPFSSDFGYVGLGKASCSDGFDGALGGSIGAWFAVSGVSIWLEEAITQPDAGMPPNSFTLCLDGELDKGFFSDIFQNILLRHSPLMHASNRLFRTHPHQFDGAPPYRRWQRVELSKALEDLIDHHSTSASIHSIPLIRSNFHPGQPLDTESIIQERLNWRTLDWKRDLLQWGLPLRQYPLTFGSWDENLKAYYEHQNQLKP
ncbi:C6 transcription factor [Fusarium sp. NRRL 52700]|nr:C6 transcription factor [Fusarium sp. NRRL 52700]